MSLLVINGPNLNLLGSREPEIYGSETLADIESMIKQKASSVTVQFFQSNAEHEIIECIHNAKAQGVKFILINPAAFTHTSVAIRDAFAAVQIPFIEVHLSNPHTREPFRHQSYFSDLAVGVIAGFGVDSYLMASEMAVKSLNNI